MTQFNSESGSDAGKRSKRGKASIIDIETLNADELLKQSLLGVHGAVIQKKVLLSYIDSHLRQRERIHKQVIDEQNMVSSNYLKWLNRSELESIMEQADVESSQTNTSH
ncbi:hypothetical protein BCU85_20730 [Vibrio lentus]|uniref:hypothetical protein n=1 Tax=Vibrio lentus TaxID=136468 RepID=UPI000C821E92|nr:hypothetical protein [Vibrio lentus]MCC4819345.1 hypothetical protein [Vibrio lentus]PMG72014.1 hypothetical protein BCU85_20730 [Vibrio lentus]PMK86328.1 hypothetical protein BCT88_12070 [Vibrio lentus]PML21296.1 hypothetical protein BCT80_15705 [Vibrio lentus]PMM24008.1 hypothetical protein BCT57_08420 [Vibrio lentus]